MSSEDKLSSHEIRLDLSGQTLDQLLLIVGDQSNDIRDLRLRVKRLEAGKPDLAESVVTSKHDAELLRRKEQAARLDECFRWHWRITGDGMPFRLVAAHEIEARIRELEQAGGGTDDESEQCS